MSVEKNLQAMGLSLPQAPRPLASYIPAVRSGNLVFCSGQLPVVEGELRHHGQVGDEVSIDIAVEAAQLCALNALAAIKTVVDDLDRVVRVVRVNGFVSSADGFTHQPAVINGASDFLVKVFGDKGQHSRIAVGVNRLPLDAPVEIDLIVEIRD